MKTVAVILLAFGPLTATADDLCEKEWPGDFAMQAHCVKEQREGLIKYEEFLKRHDLTMEQFQADVNDLKSDEEFYDWPVPQQILLTCINDWSPDFKMLAYCLNQQESAAKSLGKL